MPRSLEKIEALRLPSFRNARALAILGWGLSFGLLVFGATIIVDLRIDAWREAARDVSDHVESLTRDIIRDISLYDRSVQAVRDLMQRPDITQLSPETRRLALFGSSKITDALGAMLVLDAQGNTIADTRSPNPSPHQHGRPGLFQRAKR